MEIIEFKFDDKKTILAGVPKSGRIQFVMSCTYSDTGEIVESEIQIAGYSGESKYKFYHKKNDVFKPIKIALAVLPYFFKMCFPIIIESISCF
jgi:hypothetical protein